LRLVRLLDPALYKVLQGPADVPRKGRPIMPPAPNRHRADPEVSGRCGIAAKHHSEKEIMTPASEVPLEAR
jgi:hypothetical protein